MKQQKCSWEILVHIETIASNSCCRFFGCTSMRIHWIEIWWLWRPLDYIELIFLCMTHPYVTHLFKGWKWMTWQSRFKVIVFAVLCPFCQHAAVWAFFSNLWHQQCISTKRIKLNVYFVQKNHSRSPVSETLTPACLVQTTMPFFPIFDALLVRDHVYMPKWVAAMWLVHYMLTNS